MYSSSLEWVSASGSEGASGEGASASGSESEPIPGVGASTVAIWAEGEA